MSEGADVIADSANVLNIFYLDEGDKLIPAIKMPVRKQGKSNFMSLLNVCMYIMIFISIIFSQAKYPSEK